MSNTDIQAMMQRQMQLTFNALPYLGEPFLRKEDDPEDRQPQARQVAHVRVFKLWEEEDALVLESVLQRVAMTKAQLFEMDRQYVAEQNSFVVYLHWGDMYMVSPDIAEDSALIRAEAHARKLPNPGEDISIHVTDKPTKDEE